MLRVRARRCGAETVVLRLLIEVVVVVPASTRRQENGGLGVFLPQPTMTWGVMSWRESRTWRRVSLAMRIVAAQLVQVVGPLLHHGLALLKELGPVVGAAQGVSH